MNGPVAKFCPGNRLDVVIPEGIANIVPGGFPGYWAPCGLCGSIPLIVTNVAGPPFGLADNMIAGNRPSKHKIVEIRSHFEQGYQV